MAAKKHVVKAKVLSKTPTTTKFTFSLSQSVLEKKFGGDVEALTIEIPVEEPVKETV